MLRRSPIKRKPPRRVKDADREYLAWVASLPCVVCVKMGQMQQSKTDAHHFGPRGLGQRAPDRHAIPLCHVEHHQHGKEAVHVIGRRFSEHHGIDCFRLIELLNFEYEDGCHSSPYVTIFDALAQLSEPAQASA